MTTDAPAGSSVAAKALPPPETTIQDTLLQSVSWMCDHYSVGKSPEALTAGLPKGGLLTPSLALAALSAAGLSTGLVERRVQALPKQLVPMVLLRKEQGGCILLGRFIGTNDEGKKAYRYQVILPEIGSEPVELDQVSMDEMYAGHAILVKPRAKVDLRAGDETPQPAGHWLLSTLWRYRSYYRSAAIAAVLINVLGLASIFFTMNVYDRVVPNQAFVTLWSLGVGVAIAMIFEAVSRYVRAHLLDLAGKKADLVLGTILFRQALSIQMEHKPASSGSFANQLREFESVRDFATSATLATISDLPFVLMFVGVIFVIGGPLGWVPLLLIPLILIISVIIQWPLARTMKENMREASLKQGVLVESVEGLETLKAVGGEPYMQRRWETFSALSAATSMKSRSLSSVATGVVAFLQQLQTVVLIIIGVYLIDAGDLTMGALIATVMLASRATGPLGQVIGLAVRFQQAKAALSSLNGLMAMPVDRDSTHEYLPKPSLSGQITIKNVGFSYPAPPMQPNPTVLQGVNLTVAAGERVAILGRIGSGKSTLLRVMARLYSPTEGQMFTDGLDVNQIDPADWRKAVGYVGQDARLFYGSLRENVMIGRPESTADEFLRVLRLTGLDHIAAKHPKGINLPIGESGEGLSGGQRQLVSLARSLLARPKLLLLDEPTSAMDTQTETQFLEHLKHATEGQALVVVTHRPSLLALVDRIVVVDDGKVVADGPKDEILAKLSGKPAATQAPQRARRQRQAVAAKTPAPAATSAAKVKPKPAFMVGKNANVSNQPPVTPATAAAQAEVAS
ncbi:MULTISPECIES: type I secretion system permease/ATPase [Pseudomonas]|uniref:Type I secretion system permease/ATPase n=1 Tax=Pseudomonas cedrina TaxID=651740 RepID=A0A2S9D5G7_PSECE|nr:MULTISPECIES: type I secretion system permease/ATPase [Pseudomonas]AVJ22740.1 type I secretion system permease/ATPase [Pseudomonas sp. MYb193]PRB90100.1 type I secretion system permease/ATPase [Pseudomonas cedrina]